MAVARDVGRIRIDTALDDAPRVAPYSVSEVTVRVRWHWPTSYGCCTKAVCAFRARETRSWPN